MKNAKNLTEIQKAAEWVRHARTNHALYGDSSTEAELMAALDDFSKVSNPPPSKAQKDRADE